MMGDKNVFKIWLIWSVLLTILLGYLSYTLFSGNDKTLFMPGELSSGHHQIGLVCDACHADSFSNQATMQEKCIDCHGEQRQKPFDSHPRSKFTDPRNAERLENINAIACVSCHLEHQPQITDKTGMTQPQDFCVHCHQDIAKDRPSHQGMAFNSCASAGCHNYHNNRSLYTDFLVKHMDEPSVRDQPIVIKREFTNVLDEIASYPHDQYPVRSLTLNDMDAPAKVIVKTSDKTKHDWLTTAHAKAGANCSSCHMDKNENETEAVWNDKPNHQACSQCHEIEAKHFMQGKHGMRLKEGLSPMTPGEARLAMKPDAADYQLECNSCHQAHRYELDNAAVDACLSCHNDDHSLAYKSSPHYSLWQKQQSGEAPPGSGVSCATCHMPRVAMDVNDWLRRTVVQHNQNATLLPNEKMIRPACLQCHGLGFSIDSLADPALIRNNFNGQSGVHIDSIDMAKKDNQRHLEETSSDIY